MVGWQHRLDRHQSEQALGGGERQGSAACFSPWGRRESGMTEWLNSNKTRQRTDKRYLKAPHSQVNSFLFCLTKQRF